MKTQSTLTQLELARQGVVSDKMKQAAATEGMESTKNMVATLGRAKTLGERSLGHPDPGAVSMVLILKSMSEGANSMLNQEV